MATISCHLLTRSKRNAKMYRGVSQNQNSISRSLSISGIIVSMVLSVGLYNKDNHSGLSRAIRVSVGFRFTNETSSKNKSLLK